MPWSGTALPKVRINSICDGCSIVVIPRLEALPLIACRTRPDRAQGPTPRSPAPARRTPAPGAQRLRRLSLPGHKGVLCHAGPSRDVCVGRPIPFHARFSAAQTMQPRDRHFLKSAALRLRIARRAAASAEPVVISSMLGRTRTSNERFKALFIARHRRSGRLQARDGSLEHGPSQEFLDEECA